MNLKLNRNRSSRVLKIKSHFLEPDYSADLNGNATPVNVIRDHQERQGQRKDDHLRSLFTVVYKLLLLRSRASNRDF